MHIHSLLFYHQGRLSVSVPGAPLVAVSTTMIHGYLRQIVVQCKHTRKKGFLRSSVFPLGGQLILATCPKSVFHSSTSVCVCISEGSSSPPLEQELWGLQGPAVRSLTDQRETLLVFYLAQRYRGTHAHT